MIDILAFTAIVALVALAVYLAWPTRAQVTYVPNKGRKFGADPYYFRIDALDSNGVPATFLFTREQLSTAQERADRNPEDL